MVNNSLQTQSELVEAFAVGAGAGIKGGMSIEGDQILSFGWYPIARRVGDAIWVRQQLFSIATGKQIRTIRAVLAGRGYVETSTVTESRRETWSILTKQRRSTASRSKR